jgi:hypothetical protein
MNLAQIKGPPPIFFQKVNKSLLLVEKKAYIIGKNFTVSSLLEEIYNTLSVVHFQNCSNLLRNRLVLVLIKRVDYSDGLHPLHYLCCVLYEQNNRQQGVECVDLSGCQPCM